MQSSSIPAWSHVPTSFQSGGRCVRSLARVRFPRPKFADVGFRHLRTLPILLRQPPECSAFGLPQIQNERPKSRQFLPLPSPELAFMLLDPVDAILLLLARPGPLLYGDT